MPLQPSPLLRGFEQGADGEDVWNRMMPGEERGPLTLDPQGVALGQQFQAIKAGIEAQQARPIWNPNNRIGEETVQSMGMPQPTTYAGPVGQFIDPATGRMTEQGAARMENPMLGVDTGGLGMIKAFHGSPHAFDAFSDHAIGTGEGAQAYGYGHYLAENEGVARGYRDALTNKHQPPDLVATQDALLREIGASNDKAAALTAKGFDYDSPEVRAAIDPHEQNIKALQDKLSAMPKPTGHMYEVNVAADPEKFLHWDKPRDQLAPNVQEFAKKNYPQAWENAADGSSLYHFMSKESPSQAALSQQMAAAGIPGIRYLDQGSRGAGEGTHNAVVFDPSTMEIIRRYGLAGLMGGGAAALAGGGNQEQ